MTEINETTDSKIILVITPRLSPGATIQVVATGKKYKVEFSNISRMYEFVHENFYQCQLKSEQQVANLISTNKIVILNDGLDAAWLNINKPVTPVKVLQVEVPKSDKITPPVKNTHNVEPKSDKTLFSKG